MAERSKDSAHLAHMRQRINKAHYILRTQASGYDMSHFDTYAGLLLQEHELEVVTQTTEVAHQATGINKYILERAVLFGHMFGEILLNTPENTLHTHEFVAAMKGFLFSVGVIGFDKSVQQATETELWPAFHVLEGTMPEYSNTQASMQMQSLASRLGTIAARPAFILLHEEYIRNAPSI